MWKDKQILGFYQRVEKAVVHEGDGDINCSWCVWKSSQKLQKETGGIGNQMKNWDHIDHTALLRSARILRKVLEIWAGLLSLRFKWKATC